VRRIFTEISDDLSQNLCHRGFFPCHTFLWQGHARTKCLSQNFDRAKRLRGIFVLNSTMSQNVWQVSQSVWQSGGRSQSFSGEKLAGTVCMQFYNILPGTCCSLTGHTLGQSVTVLSHVVTALWHPASHKCVTVLSHVVTYLWHPVSH